MEFEMMIQVHSNVECISNKKGWEPEQWAESGYHWQDCANLIDHLAIKVAIEIYRLLLYFVRIQQTIF
jgi:hypothetical protein